MMDNKSKRDLVLTLLLVIAVLSLASTACNDSDGNLITVEVLSTRAVVEVDGMIDSLGIELGDEACETTGLNCR